MKEVKVVVHFGKSYNNRFWDGSEAVLGDGDGVLFAKFSDLDTLTALANAIVYEKANLPYINEQGALAVHLGDVFAAMVVQWHEKQRAESASWLIGSGAFSPKFEGSALRSMKAPGSAYDNPTLGKDPQPAHMKNYARTKDDNGGVHINCGIPNRAFYLAATEIGGFSWESTGKIWIKSLEHITANTDFKGFAAITLQTAEDLYGKNSDEANAVAKAWSEVGIDVHGKRK
jgi:Zn-dependent metalloprotease